MATPRRDLLIETAMNLFNKHGLHGTGIDKVQAESGVSKTTLYKYFKSKEELIIAALDMRNKRFYEWMDGKVLEYAAAYKDNPNAKIFALFDALDEWFQTEEFCGCGFVNATAEYTCPDHDINQFCKQGKCNFISYIEGLLPRDLNSDRREMALSINMVVEGATVCAHSAGFKDSAQRAKRITQALLS